MLQQNIVIVSIVLFFIIWYYYNKFRESEKSYYKLHQRCLQLFNENQVLQNKIKDLQSYKNDVSKTFRILDNELLMINDHLKKRTPQALDNLNSMEESLNINTNPLSNENVSLLTPEILSNLFTNINQEIGSIQTYTLHNTNSNSNVDTQNQTNELHESHYTNTNGNTNSNGNVTKNKMYENVSEELKQNVLNDLNNSQETEFETNELQTNELQLPGEVELDSEYEKFLI